MLLTVLTNYSVLRDTYKHLSSLRLYVVILLQVVRGCEDASLRAEMRSEIKESI